MRRAPSGMGQAWKMNGGCLEDKDGGRERLDHRQHLTTHHFRSRASGRFQGAGCREGSAFSVKGVGPPRGVPGKTASSRDVNLPRRLQSVSGSGFRDPGFGIR